jgi:FKBP-type peptidyl-prolyl cis-trans isomerase FklB
VRKAFFISGLTAVVLMAAFGCSAKKGVSELKTLDQKVSYAFGKDMGAYLKSMSITIDKEALFQGIEDTLEGKKSMLTPEQITAIKQEFGKKMQEEQMAKAKAAGEKNIKEGEVFLEKNKAEKGVTVTASGLQYTVLTPGAGAIPKATDVVTVNYRGTLIDGKEFDSSYKRGQPATFPVNGVIPGWTEMLQLMKIGEKVKVVIPSKLAYGERGAGQDIGPNATLVFEVELLAINPENKNPPQAIK